MSETWIFRTETRPRREVSTSREIENETRREIKQSLNILKDLKQRVSVFTLQGVAGGGGGGEKRESPGGMTGKQTDRQSLDKVGFIFVSYSQVGIRMSIDT